MDNMDKDLIENLTQSLKTMHSQGESGWQLGMESDFETQLFYKIIFAGPLESVLVID